MHPFEKAGLGKAPYRCVGVRENRFEMPGFGWKPGGSCCYCGTGILYEYIIEDSTGRKPFVVGSDCVAKTYAEVNGFREVRLKHAREKRQAGAQARREERAKAWALERQERAAANRESWLAEHAELDAKIRAAAGSNSFLASMVSNLEQWGGLTERMVAAAERSLAVMERNAKARELSKPVGEIGKRVKKVKGRVVMCKALEPRPKYSAPWILENRYLTKIELEDGSVIVYFGNHGFSEEGADGELEVWSFTPKEHSEYEGVAQTIVARLALHAEATNGIAA